MPRMSRYVAKQQHLIEATCHRLARCGASSTLGPKKPGFSLGECCVLPETSNHQHELDCIVAKNQVSEPLRFLSRFLNAYDIILCYIFNYPRFSPIRRDYSMPGAGSSPRGDLPVGRCRRKIGHKCPPLRHGMRQLRSFVTDMISGCRPKQLAVSACLPFRGQ